MKELENNFINEKNIDLVWENIQELYSIYRNEEQSFYEQIQYIENMRWNGDKVQENLFQASYPSIPKMSENQFAFYMYYRTQMLNGTFSTPTSVSYIYTLMYEILTGIKNIKIDRITEILDYLLENTRKYIKEDYGITRKIAYWKPKILLLYEYKNQGKKPANINMIQYQKNDLILWENIAKYYIEESEFIKEYNLLDQVKNVLDNIIRELEAKYEPEKIDIIRFLVGDLNKKIDFEKFFPNSIWTNSQMCNFLPIECGEIQYNAKSQEEVYILDEFGNTIKRMNVFWKEVWNNMALYILKSIEIMFASVSGYKIRQRKPLIDKNKNGIKIYTAEGQRRCFSHDRNEQYRFLCEIPNIINIADDTINTYIENNRERFPVKITKSDTKNKKKNTVTDSNLLKKKEIEEVVTTYTIQNARNVLYKNQERLVIAETEKDQIEERPVIITKEFSEVEIKLLKLLLANENYNNINKKISKEYFTINMVCKNINEKSMELIGDIVIDDSTGEIQIIKDYIDICKKWVRYDE